jgi:hypothetical protein
MFIFYRLEGTQRTQVSGADLNGEEEARGYVKGLAAASQVLQRRVWVTGSLPNEAGVDNDGWRSAEVWLEEQPF